MIRRSREVDSVSELEMKARNATKVGRSNSPWSIETFGSYIYICNPTNKILSNELLSTELHPCPPPTLTVRKMIAKQYRSAENTYCEDKPRERERITQAISITFLQSQEHA